MHTKPLVWIEIDSANIAWNVIRLKEYVGPQAQLVVEVQANGFGHGCLPVSKTVLNNGVIWLSVACIQEGKELREEGIQNPIFVSHTFAEEAEEIVLSSLTPIVSTLQMAEALSKASDKYSKSTPIHLSIEVNANDVQAITERTTQLAQEIVRLPSVSIEGVFSQHSPLSKEAEDARRRSFSIFRRLHNLLKKMGIPISYRQGSLGDSLLAPSKDLFNLVRVGSATYGIHDANSMTENLSLEPALSLKTQVFQVVEQHSVVDSPDFDPSTEKQTRLCAVIPIGMSHGLSYSLSDKGEVLIRGQRARIAGKIGTHNCQVDVTHIVNVQVGDEVVIIGQQQKEKITVEEIAEKLHTVGSEISCRVSERTHKIYRSCPSPILNPG